MRKYIFYNVAFSYELKIRFLEKGEKSMKVNPKLMEHLQFSLSL